MAFLSKPSFSFKIGITFVVLFAFIMAAVVITIRNEVERKYTRQYEETVTATLTATREEIAARHNHMRGQLKGLAEIASTENAFRLMVSGAVKYYQTPVVDFAMSHQPTMGLDALTIADWNGMILSAAHYRMDFERQFGAEIARLEEYSENSVIMSFLRQTGPFPCFTALEKVQVQGRTLYVLGGLEITPKMVQLFRGDANNAVVLALPNQTIAGSDSIDLPDIKRIDFSKKLESGIAIGVEENYSIGKITLPYVMADSTDLATLYLFHPRDELNQLLDQLANLLMIIGISGALLILILTPVLVKILLAPLEDLAEEADKLTLDNLDVNFKSGTKDETGVLADALNRMVSGLLRSRRKLASAEKKAALGELARQVNHDVKNGFLPIKNVMQHWEEVADNEPENLREVFNDRKSVVKNSLQYMEKLTRNYLRLQPKYDPERIEINQLIAGVADSFQEIPEKKISLETALSDNPLVYADRVQLQRAFENVLKNSIEAIETDGFIRISTDTQNGSVIIRWEDNGVGIPPEIHEQLFTTQITTKPDGTGIGLANVKRIVEEAAGQLHIDSEPGKGTRVNISLPLHYR